MLDEIDSLDVLQLIIEIFIIEGITSFEWFENVIHKGASMSEVQPVWNSDVCEQIRVIHSSSYVMSWGKI